jgi:hypothetical protein
MSVATDFTSHACAALLLLFQGEADGAAGPAEAEAYGRNFEIWLEATR